jgi:hypothetical protein
MSKLGKELIESAKEAVAGEFGRITVFLDKVEMLSFLEVTTGLVARDLLINKFSPVDSMFDATPEALFWRITIEPVKDEQSEIGA